MYPCCQFGPKKTFIFLQKLAYSWPKTLQKSFNVMFSAKQRWSLCNNAGIQLKHSVLREILAKKTPLKPKKIICVDLPIFRQDNYQNATNQLKLYVFQKIAAKFVLKH